MTSATRVTRQEAATLIACEGHLTTYLIEGQPGIGKTSIARDVLALVGGNRPIVTVDCTVVSDGDIAVPVVLPGGTTVRYAINELYMAGNAENPPIIVLDEIGKAPDSIRNAFSPLMLERRLFNQNMPEGTIVLATKNLASDNVGENEMMGHTCNRLGFLELEPPTANEWVGWAQNNLGFNCPEIIAFAIQNPALFHTYSAASAETNTWIYNPSHPSQCKHFASPRSLESAARTLRFYTEGKIPSRAVLPALAGKIGGSAASLLWQYVNFARDIPSIEDIFENGVATAKPKNVSQHFMLASSLTTAARSLVREEKDRGERQRKLNNMQDYVYGKDGRDGSLSTTAQHLTSYFFSTAGSAYLHTTQPRIMDGISKLVGFRDHLV